MTIARVINLCLLIFMAGTCAGADLTGNWVAATPLEDGTFRRAYFDLKQEGSRITGHIRVTQFYYTITESRGGPDGFTITGTLQDGKTLRRVQYEGKLMGEELHLGTRRRPDAPMVELIAHRTQAGEGA